jgi:hypothetical protein
MKHQFSPKFRSLPKAQKINKFVNFARDHEVLINGSQVSNIYYSEGEDSFFFNSGNTSIIIIKSEIVLSAKIDGNTLSGQDEFGAFIIRFFNLTPASITL